MSFVISDTQFPGSEKIGELHAKGNYLREGENLLLFKGEVFNYDSQRLTERIRIEGIDVVPKIEGGFVIVRYDNTSKEISFGNDRIGREPLFYFHDGKNFILSDNFWEVLNLIDSNSSRIDPQSVKEFAVFGYTLSYDTIIKNLCHFPPASIGKYLLREHKLDINQYWDLVYNPKEDLSIDEAIERLDLCFDSFISRIATRHASETIYGLGLSGGLDSRLIPHYAVKHNMILKCFIIGEKSPHNLFLSFDRKCAREIARYYGLDLFEVDYNADPLEIKSIHDIQYYPMGHSQVFITLLNSLPSFDVLLNGLGGGELFGSNIPADIMHLSKDALVDYIIQRYSYIYKFHVMSMSTSRFINFILRGKMPSKTIVKRDSIEGILTRDEFAEARNKIFHFVEANSNKSNISIIQKYLLFINMKGSYLGFNESLHGTKPSYSLFLNPYVLPETLTWKHEFLINRHLQTQLYLKKFTELSKIPSDYQVPIFYREENSLHRKITSLVDYVVRGKGLEFIDWAWNKKFKAFSFKILSRESHIFDSMFDKTKILTLPKADMRIFENLVKIKQITDLLESNGYKNFVH